MRLKRKLIQLSQQNNVDVKMKKTAEGEEKTYKYEELNEQAKENARDWYKKIMDNDFHWEAQDIKESFEYDLEQLGFEVDDISFDLGYSQGSYVGFEGEMKEDNFLNYIRENINKSDQYTGVYTIGGEEVDKTITYLELFNKHQDDLTFYNRIETSHRGNVSADSFADIYMDMDDENYTAVEKLMEYINNDVLDGFQDHVKGICKDLMKKGYDMIDYYYSDENVEEMITINEYDFDEEGNRA